MCLTLHVTLHLCLFPPGLDYVSHEDILPYNSTEQVPIQHELFERFLMYNPAKCKHSPPVSTLASNNLLHTALYKAQWFTFHCSSLYEHISSHTEVLISHIHDNIYCQVKYWLYCLYINNTFLVWIEILELCSCQIQFCYFLLSLSVSSINICACVFCPWLDPAAPPFTARDTLKAWQEKNHPWLELSDVHRETTENIRVTVIPFYMGMRVNSSVLKEI